MKMLFNLSLLILLLAPAVHAATPSAAEGVARDCEKVLFGNSAQQHAAALKRLREIYENAVYTPVRANREAFAYLEHFVIERKAEIENRRGELRAIKDQETRTYDGYGFLSRRFGEGARHYAEKIAAVANELAATDRVLTSLESLRAEINDAARKADGHQLARVAELVFGLAINENYTADHATSLTRALLNSPRDLRGDMKLATEMWYKFTRQFGVTSDAAVDFTSSLMRQGKTDEASIQTLGRVYNAISGWKEDGEVILLTLGLFRMGKTSEASIRWANGLFNEANSYWNVDEGTAAMVAFLVVVSGGSKNDIKPLIDRYQNILGKRWFMNDNTARTILMASYLSGKSSDADIDTMLSIFDRVLNFKGMTWADAGADEVAAALFLTGHDEQDFAEAEKLYQTCYAMKYCSADNAGSLVNAILMRDHRHEVSSLVTGIDLNEAIDNMHMLQMIIILEILH